MAEGEAIDRRLKCLIRLLGGRWSVSSEKVENEEMINRFDEKNDNQEQAPVVPEIVRSGGYTLKEAAFKLRMSEKSVRRLIYRGHIRMCKPFGRIRIPCGDVDTFIERNSEYSFSV